MDEDQAAIDVDDILTSFDFNFSNYAARTFDPERNLLMSVLIYGVIDYLSANRKAYYRDARAWFFNEDEDPDYIYGFSNICSILGVLPDAFRAKLKTMKKMKVKMALDGKRIQS